MNYKINKEDLTLFVEKPIEYDDYFVLNPKVDAKRKLKTSITKINVVDRDSADILIKKKLKRQLEKVIALTLMVLDDEDEDPGVIEAALDEAAKFYAMLKYKYEQFLDQEYAKEQHTKLKRVVDELKRKRAKTPESRSTGKGR